MIFVTVGSTMKFDGLIREIDNLVGQGAIKEPVICQIGTGDYLPEHCEYFRFKPSLDEFITKAGLVIGHADTGTVLSLVTRQKSCIFMVNNDGADNHQHDFMSRLEKDAAILWSDNIADLATLIDNAKKSQPPNITPPTSIAIDLLDYLGTI